MHVLFVLAWIFHRAFNGAVEGINNLPDAQKASSQDAYHLCRIGQELGVFFILFSGIYLYREGMTTLIIFIISVLSWIGSDGLYNRILQRIVMGKWNVDMPVTGSPFWTWTSPSPLIDWLKLIVFIPVAVIV
jgi:hypothetical protein